MAGVDFYSFIASPSDLFKICFINHFTLDHPDGKPAYQRMVSSARIRKIAKFIAEEKGYFPTNILLNFKSRPKFELLSNKENTNENIKFGWLTLPSQYRSAWVIDGQHRLFGYAHLEERRQQSGNLFVLAFNQLSVNDEAELFVKINSEQKSVPRSLLESLIPELKSQDDNPKNIITALASRGFIRMGADTDSPFFGRFAKHGIPATEYQSLTLSEAIKGLKSTSFLGEVRGKSQIDGFFTGENDEQTIQKTTFILKAYFNELKLSNATAWEDGKAGYIATNPGIRAHLGVMKEVIAYLSYKRDLNFGLMSQKEVAEIILAFCQPIYEYFREAPSSEIQEKFSRKFGEGGVKHYRLQLLKILNNTNADFGPEEFKGWLIQTNSDDFSSIHDQIMAFSETLTNTVINGLRQLHGTEQMSSGEPKYWEVGAKSPRVRRNAYEKQQMDNEAERSKKEAYLEIVDLEEIVKDRDNWSFFENLFKNPMPGERHGQKYYLGWLGKFNGLRKIAAHRNQEKIYSREQLEFFEWLNDSVIPKFDSSLN